MREPTRDQVAARIAAVDGRHVNDEPLADATYEDMAEAAIEVFGGVLFRDRDRRDRAESNARIDEQHMLDLYKAAGFPTDLPIEEAVEKVAAMRTSLESGHKLLRQLIGMWRQGQRSHPGYEALRPYTLPLTEVDRLSQDIADWHDGWSA